MIMRRVIAGAAAAGAAEAAAAALVVALVYALFALFRTWVGPSGAAAGVALVIAILFGVALLVLLRRSGGPPKPKRNEVVSGAPLDRILAVARERPIVAAAAAISAGLIAIRNPALLTILTRTFVDPKRKPAR